MDFVIFIIGIIAMLGFVYLGYTRQGFIFAYIGMFIAILLGISLFQSGLDLQTGTDVVAVGDNFTITDSYTNHSVTNDSLINLLANLFLYGGVVGVIMTTFITVRS